MNDPCKACGPMWSSPPRWYAAELRRNQESGGELSETFEAPPGGWQGPPFRVPSPIEDPNPDKFARRDLFIAIATGVLVLGAIGGGVFLATRPKRRRARR